MNKIMVKVEDVNGMLVTTSNRVAEELEVRHDHLIEKIDTYILKFSSPELSGQFYIPSEYKTLNGRTVRNYLITKKGIAQLIGGYSSAVEKAFELNVAYINKFEEMEKQLGTIVSYEDRLKLGLFSKDPEIVARSHKALLELELKPLKEELEQKAKEIEYKEDVIIGLTDKIDLMDMRQILNTVVRYKGANFQERWRLLYFEFEKKYHIDIKRRMDNYNNSNKPKIKSKLDYIETILNKLPQLYEIACKLFEGDINQIIENYKKVC
ncbi:MAG: Rha family transcriptional regulator [Fusobacterium sp.]|uniref:Rha family transcriptional regulator n=1 Tax=Fusobacterium sp. TaxID=68766 RepID=UPI003994E956